MDHTHINEFDLVERYLMGRLAAEETAEFEEHFVDCLQCVDRLTTTKAFMDGLRLVASDQAREAPTHSQREASWLWRATISRKSLALAAGFLCLVVLAGALVLTNRIRHSQVEADQARIASAEWERRYEEERQSLSLSEMKTQDSERELNTRIAQLEAGLGDEHKQDAGGGRGGKNEPQINFQSFILHATRGSEPGGGAANELIVPVSPANFAISVVLEEEVNYKVYRMTLLGEGRQTIWTRGGHRPGSSNLLSVEFNSTLFRSGNDYILKVEGVAGDGSTSVVGEYPFRVIKRP